jgi:tRNA threonylcarbamoyladenosine biosynthesis protein TsaB
VIVLAIDTSHRVGSAAVSAGGSAASAERFGEGSSHLLEIGRCIDRLLGRLGLMPRDVHRLALVRGPGSFTGLRIGMAYAKGLCAGLGAEMVVMSSLELLALPLLRSGDTVCVMVDARKGEVYGAVYEPGRPSAAFPGRALIDPRVCSPESIVEEARRYSPTYVGTGALHYRSTVESSHPGCRIGGQEVAFPSAALLAQIAPGLDPLSDEALASLEPLYLRPSDAVFKPLKPIDPHG